MRLVAFSSPVWGLKYSILLLETRHVLLLKCKKKIPV